MWKQFQIVIRDGLGGGVGAKEFRAERVDGTNLVDAKDEVFGVRTDLGTGEGFRGKADGEGGGRRVRSNRSESSTNFGRGMGRHVVHRHNEGAKVLAFGAALAGTESRGERAGAHVRDAWATADRAAGDFESERGRVARKLDGFRGEAQEGVGGGNQRQGGDFVRFSGDVGTLGAAKVFHVGRSRMDIAHAFVKTDVDGILDFASFEIKPQYIFRGVGGITEKNASFGMEGEFGRAFARRADPHAASKSTKIGEIILVFGAA